MKLLLLSLSTLFIGSVWGQFYPVPDLVLDGEHKLEAGRRNTYLGKKVESFSMSKFVTVSEFKVYLEAVKKDSGMTYYESQLPKSGQMKPELVKAILEDEQLQDEPMPGVSWQTARNYCVWLTALAKKDNINYYFELPQLGELLGFEQTYRNTPVISKNKLSSWTYTSYDESVYEFAHDLSPEYTYEARPNDPPAMKRKVVYGSSYHMNFSPSTSYGWANYEYQDSSSRYVGFRVTRKLGSEAPAELIRRRGPKRELIKMTITGETLEESDQVSYGISDNHFYGVYAEKYENGKLKVLGEFYNGQRVGVWSIWKEGGELALQRNYWGNGSVTFQYPYSTNIYEDLYEKYPAYTLERDKDNIYKYGFLEERAVAYSKRLWRVLDKENEKKLFRQVDFKAFVESLINTDVVWYEYGESGEFKTVIKDKELEKLKKEAAEWDYNRIQIKEDFYFSKDHLTGNARQIGLNFYKNEKDETPAYSLYYPQIRPYLAKFKLNLSTVNDVQHADDYFFFNEFRGKIVKEARVLDRGENLFEDLKIELSKLRAEHDLWLDYGR